MNKSSVSSEPGGVIRKSNQVKALLIKNLRLQSKQKCTNVCQILTPVICLLFTFLMKELASQSLPNGSVFLDNQYPYVFNNFQEFDRISPGLRNPTEWYLYSYDQATCNLSMLGVKDGTSKASATLLGLIPDTSNYAVSFNPNVYNSTPETSLFMPFFKLANGSGNLDLFNRINTIETSSFSYLKKGGLDYMPDGVVHFIALNSTRLSMNVQINDCRDLDLHRINAITAIRERKRLKETPNISVNTNRNIISSYGMLNLLHYLSSSYTKLVAGATVQSGYMLMPDTGESKSFVDSIISTVAALVFPLALSLLFPVMLYGVVLQKEEKLIQMMKMNGMKIRNYWFVFFLFNFLLCVVTSLIFFILGVVLLKLPFFTHTSPALLLLVMLGWSLAQIGLAAFCQTFLNKARSANIIGYLISIWTMMIGATLNIGAYQYPSHFPFWLQVLPPFGFNRLFYLMLIKCSDQYCFSSLGEITTEMKQCIAFLYIGFLFFFGLGAYLFEVLPQELGVRRSFLFPFQDLWKFLTCKTRAYSISETGRDAEYRKYICEDEEDELSKAERTFVERLDTPSNYPLVINNLRKLYKKDGYANLYPAVRSFNLKIDHKETFGLLGPNGAGKTTLISMITGMFEPEYGNAWIGGYDISSKISQAQLQMGVCPQFDLLWPQMTVEEHLYFYARLKGISGKDLEQKVTQAILEVKLIKFRKFVASSLSGGMKRRLSIAISLVGDPKIVFLDEPSTGLDPENRRQLWEVLASCQQKRALFLTTHIMEEADTLCHRVGIITHGTLRTVANQLRLKNIYGGGYRLNINLIRQERKLVCGRSLHLGLDDNLAGEEEDLQSSIKDLNAAEGVRLAKISKHVTAEITRRFPRSSLAKSFSGALIFKIPLDFKISQVFEEMHFVEQELSIADISLTNSSLEDVFMNVVQQYDKYNDPVDGEPIRTMSLPTEGEREEPRDSREEQQGVKNIQVPSQSVLRRRAEEQRLGSVVQKDRESLLSDYESKQIDPKQIERRRAEETKRREDEQLGSIVVKNRQSQLSEVEQKEVKQGKPENKHSSLEAFSEGNEKKSQNSLSDNGQK